MGILRSSVVFCLLWGAPAGAFATTSSVIDAGVSWQSITISPEQMVHAKTRGNALLARSDLTLLFEAEKTIHLATLLEPALLISHHESAVNFPHHHLPTSTVLRLKPQKAVDQIFQALQEELCQHDPTILDLSLDDTITSWLPVAIAAVPAAVTTSSSIQFAQDLAATIVVLFFKIGQPDACYVDSPYEGTF